MKTTENPYLLFHHVLVKLVTVQFIIISIVFLCLCCNQMAKRFAFHKFVKVTFQLHIVTMSIKKKHAKYNTRFMQKISYDLPQLKRQNSHEMTI